MPRLLLAMSSLPLALALAACTPSGIDMNTQASAATSSSAGTKKPFYRKNPDPKQAYRITMTIKDAPGPFEHVLGLAQFDVVNPECLPPPDSNPGGHTSPVPTEGVEIPLTKGADGTYSGVVYVDQMLDEDYYGRGVCRWELIQAQVQLKATGKNDEAKFIPDIPGRTILSEGTATTYLSKRPYPRDAELADMAIFGQRDRSKMAIPDEELFSVTLEAGKEAL